MSRTLCKPCKFAKHHRTIFPQWIKKHWQNSFALVHNTSFLCGFKYFITFIVLAWRGSILRKEKLGVLNISKFSQENLLYHFNADSKILRTENGGEYVFNELLSLGLGKSFVDILCLNALIECSYWNKERTSFWRYLMLFIWEECSKILLECCWSIGFFHLC